MTIKPLKVETYKIEITYKEQTILVNFMNEKLDDLINHIVLYFGEQLPTEFTMEYLDEDDDYVILQNEKDAALMFDDYKQLKMNPIKIVIGRNQEKKKVKGAICVRIPVNDSAIQPREIIINQSSIGENNYNKKLENQQGSQGLSKAEVKFKFFQEQKEESPMRKKQNSINESQTKLSKRQKHHKLNKKRYRLKRKIKEIKNYLIPGFPRLEQKPVYKNPCRYGQNQQNRGGFNDFNEFKNLYSKKEIKEQQRILKQIQRQNREKNQQKPAQYGSQNAKEDLQLYRAMKASEKQVKQRSLEQQMEEMRLFHMQEQSKVSQKKENERLWLDNRNQYTYYRRQYQEEKNKKKNLYQNPYHYQGSVEDDEQETFGFDQE